MAIKNERLGGTDWVNGERLDAEPDLNDTINAIGYVPIGTVLPWLKTFNSVDSGTTTSTLSNKLVDSGQNFSSTVTVGDVVHNTTDNTFAYVTAIDDNETLSLDSDIMTSGEDFSIYSTPALTGGFVECNGQVLSDAESKYDGATIPDLNGASGNQRFLRGNIFSGTTGGSEEHNHQWLRETGSSNGLGIETVDTGSESWADGSYDSDGSNLTIVLGSDPLNGNAYTNNTSTLPSYYEVVYIMRVK